jgi:hypothetical protein
MMIFFCSDLIINESSDYLQSKNVLMFFDNLHMEQVLILWMNITNSMRVWQVNASKKLCAPLLCFFLLVHLRKPTHEQQLDINAKQ